MEFAGSVVWRVSKRGLVIGGLDGEDAVLLEHPRAAALPALVAAAGDPAALAGALGGPRPDRLVTEMLDAGILTHHPDPNPYRGSGSGPGAGPHGPAATTPAPTPGVGGSPITAGPAARARTRGVVFTRSGVEFPGIERPARWLEHHTRPLWGTWPGRTALALVVAAGAVALAAGRPGVPAVSAHPWADALLGFAVGVVCSALHELAHAVALIGYGRRPRRAGFGFYWGGISFYVDSTDALTLPRRARVTQALVGLGVDLVTTSLLALATQLTTTVLLVAVAWRMAILGLLGIVINLAPILSVDGHWALADYLDEPDLAPRARAALAATLRPPPTPDPADPVGLPERWLVVYGAASLAGGLALLVGAGFVWWAAAGDLLRALLAGNPADIVIGVLLVGPIAASLLFSTLGLILETTNTD